MEGESSESTPPGVFYFSSNVRIKHYISEIKEDEEDIVNNNQTSPIKKSSPLPVPPRKITYNEIYL